MYIFTRYSIIFQHGSGAIISFLIDMSKTASKETAEAVHPEILSGFEKSGCRNQGHLLLWCRKSRFLTCCGPCHKISSRTMINIAIN